MLEELKKMGLSENEAKVYLALLELGSSTAQQIAQKAQVNRATTYVQVESLMKMGLVTSFDKGKKTFLRAEDPEYLKKVIEKQKLAIKDEESALQNILPQLGNLFLSAGERPRVRFFEGLEGVQTISEEVLKSGVKNIEAINSADIVLQKYPQQLEEYTPRRIKKGIHSKLIYTSSRGPFLKESDTAALRESRFIPQEKLAFYGDITIFGNKFSLEVTGAKPFGIIIESKELADSMRALFNFMWGSAEKYQ